MRNKNLILILMFVFLLVGVLGGVSAEKTWSFHNYSLNVSNNLDVAGNSTITGTGFFGYLGSLANEITKLFVQDVQFSGTINGSGNIITTGNLTASYFFGDGSGLTNLNVNEIDLSNYYTIPQIENNFTNYYTIPQIENNFTNYYTSAQVNALPVSTFTNDNSYYNSTTLTTNSQLENGNNYWNDTFATFNKTYADALYSTIDEPLWTSNFTAYNDSWTTTNSEIWSVAGNGTLMFASNWNATNTSYYLASNPSGYIDWAKATNGTLATWVQAMNGTLMSQATYDLNYTTLMLQSTFDLNYSLNDPIYRSWSANYSDYLTTKSNANSWLANYSDFLTTQTYATNWNLNYTSATLTLPNNLAVAKNLTVDTSTLFVNSNTDRVGIGTSSPQNTLNVVGDINVTNSDVSMFMEGGAFIISG